LHELVRPVSSFVILDALLALQLEPHLAGSFSLLRTGGFGRTGLAIPEPVALLFQLFGLLFPTAYFVLVRFEVGQS